jgi:DNA-binding GntR family transcriptional regulator
MNTSLLDLIAAPELMRKSASDQVLKILKDAIVRGVLPAGEVLRQDEIAARFGVSKIPVREALKRLEAEGLVSFTQNRGAVVAALSVEEIEEYMEIRAMLEEKAARLSAPRISDASLARADQVLARYAADPDISHWGELNWEFHSTLYADAQRPTLLAFIRSIHDKVERYVRYLLSHPAEMPNTQREHRAILDAFRRRDPDAAAKLTRAHVLDAGASLVQYLKQDRQLGGDR